MISYLSAPKPLFEQRRGLMLVLSSPSGAGKSTIARLLLDEEAEIDLSVSVTTRPRRAGELDGAHYYFVDETRFEALREAGELLEWARVFGHLYGTPRRMVEGSLSSGRDVLFDIDWQGGQQLALQSAVDLVRVFVLPPSGKELHDRLKRRAQDGDDVISNRMAEAANEIGHWIDYDYVVINNDLERCVAQLRTILAAERLKRERRPRLTDIVNGLLKDL